MTDASEQRAILRAMEVPLILGGHSFIAQLGNDPAPSLDDQMAIVAACLDAGLVWFDTTYRPERVALGRALEALGRRAEARIIAWNFFTDFGPEGSVGGPDYYREEHLAVLQEEFRTEHINALVVHDLDDPEENARHLEVARSWQAAGAVGVLGTWAPGPDAHDRVRANNPYQFMVHPYNVDTPEAGPAFRASKQLGWTTFACSPFVRGWRLEELVAAAGRQASLARETLTRKVADVLLRHSLFQADVDALIVSMRRPEWVGRNVASWRRGPLTTKESAWLGGIIRAARG